ncbi:thioredoxin domain-containing protein [Nesterenkonia sp. NBAIMH1]|uniref:DsbA family protein n=1 Tax=Nesterenkonia sp. NBAIMH1 TaxID=2600320 RepID=UPI0011B4938A|nr:thioredoxin domain-containing protein [Nesterenkonia sp. NBAIMH1]
MARSTESADARERARKMQAEQAKKEKRSTLLLPVIVVVLAVAMVAGLVLWVVNRDDDDAAYTEGPAPSVANEYGGITLTSSTEVADGTDIGTVDAEDVPERDDNGTAPRQEGQAPHLVIYTDPGCPACQQMEETYGSTMAELLDQGLITAEFRSVQVVGSPTNYSARASNAFACMAEESPENYKDYLTDITATYAQDELSNEGLAQAAQERYDADISSCVEEGTYRPFGSWTTNQASDTLAQMGVQFATPTVFIDDQEYGLDFMEALGEEIDAYAAEAGDDVEADVDPDAETDAEQDEAEEGAVEVPEDDE